VNQSPTTIDDSANEFIVLAKIKDIASGNRKIVQLEGEDYVLLAFEGEYYLLSNICPHAGYPLEAGSVIKTQIGPALRCPMHGYLFQLYDGALTYFTEGRCAGLRRIPLTQQGDDLGIIYPIK
jgi:nitrite reductase/ring-hydroxylating ferredoxin subunit